MSTFTENYNLIKPDEADYYDVQDFNENFDTIDTQLAQTAALAEEVGENVGSIDAKIGTPEDTGDSTIFGKLNAGGSFIKSIQAVDVKVTFDGKTYSADIQTVDPDKCIVIAILLYNTSTTFYRMDYTLSANQISVATENKGSVYAGQRYQIIEFY